MWYPVEYLQYVRRMLQIKKIDCIKRVKQVDYEYILG